MYIKAWINEITGLYGVMVYADKPVNDIGHVLEAYSGSDIVMIAQDIKDRYPNAESAYVLTGNGDEWIQPDCLTLAECLEASAG